MTSQGQFYKLPSYKDLVAEAIAAHVADKHSNRQRDKFIPVFEGYMSDGLARTWNHAPVAEGLANSDEPRVFFTMKVPDDYVSFVSLKAVWGCSVAGGRNMYWRLRADYAAPGELAVLHQDYPDYGVTTCVGNNLLSVQEHPNPLTLISLAKGDFIFLDWRRLGSNPLDTLEENMRLIGLVFTYVGER